MTYLYKIAAGICLVTVGVDIERGNFGMAAFGFCLAAFALIWADFMKGGE
jgi:hypothetical protein